MKVRFTPLHAMFEYTKTYLGSTIPRASEDGGDLTWMQQQCACCIHLARPIDIPTLGDTVPCLP